MHRVDSRTYVGQPNELVTLTTQVSGGGQVRVVVNGQDLGPARQFPLPPNPSDRVKFQVSLMGPLGASCVVSISTVDGGSDGDFLMCQAHNPAPVNFYTCSVVGVPALQALADAKGLQPPQTASARQTEKGKKAGKASASKKKGSGE